MNSQEILKKAGIRPDEPVLLVTAKEAIQNLLETMEEYCPGLKIDKMAKEDIKTLLDSYGACIIEHHPEHHHQERAVLLKNFEMLRKYGSKDEDYEIIDFC